MTLLPCLLLAVLAAAPAQPRASAQAEPAIYLPRLDQLSGLRDFLERAGRHSSLLQPSTWTQEFHPFLPLDPTRAESLLAAGLDPQGSATVSVVGESVIACASVRDAAAFTALADRRLAEMGAVQRSTSRTVTRVLASEPGGRAAGYVLAAGQECSVAGRGPPGPLLDEAARLVLKPSAGPALRKLGALPGVAYVASRWGTLALEGNAGELRVQGRLLQPVVPQLAAARESPYGRMAPSGLLFLRARVDPSSLEQASSLLAAQVASACRTCDRRVLKELAGALAGRLAGNVLLRVDRVVPGKLRTPSEQYFALRHAYLAEVTGPEEVDRLLERLAGLEKVRRTEGGYVLATAGGHLEVGRSGRHLYLGNDVAAIQAVLRALPGEPGKLAHGMDFVADAPRLARALGQVSLLDALQAPELAALFATAVELGPLLAATERVAGWADISSGGTHRFQVVWSLGAARPGPKEH